MNQARKHLLTLSCLSCLSCMRYYPKPWGYKSLWAGIVLYTFHSPTVQYCLALSRLMVMMMLVINIAGVCSSMSPALAGRDDSGTWCRAQHSSVHVTFKGKTEEWWTDGENKLLGLPYGGVPFVPCDQCVTWRKYDSCSTSINTPSNEEWWCWRIKLGPRLASFSIYSSQSSYSNFSSYQPLPSLTGRILRDWLLKHVNYISLTLGARVKHCPGWGWGRTDVVATSEIHLSFAYILLPPFLLKSMKKHINMVTFCSMVKTL